MAQKGIVEQATKTTPEEDEELLMEAFGEFLEEETSPTGASTPSSSDAELPKQ